MLIFVAFFILLFIELSLVGLARGICWVGMMWCQNTPELNFDRFTVKHAFQNTQNDCHQWHSDTIAGLRGPTSKGRREEGKEKSRGGRVM